MSHHREETAAEASTSPAEMETEMLLRSRAPAGPAAPASPCCSSGSGCGGSGADARRETNEAQAKAKANHSAVQPLPARSSVWRRPSRLQLLSLAPLALVLYLAALRPGVQWLCQSPLWRWQQDLLAVDDPRWHRPKINAAGVAVIEVGEPTPTPTAGVQSPSDPPAAPIPPPDALIVLGYCVDHSRRLPTAPLVARLELAMLESCVHRVPVVIFSGGSDSARVELGQPSEAEIMAEWFAARWAELQAPASQLSPIADPVARELRDRTHQLCRGLPLPRFLLESTSTSTFENAYHSLSLLLRSEPLLRRLRIVTNRFHQARSLAIFLKMEARRLERMERDARRTMWTPRPGLNSQPHETQRLGEGLEILLEQGAAIDPEDPATASTTTAAPARPRHFEFSIATMPLEQSTQIPQLDFFREVLATMLYTVRRWI